MSSILEALKRSEADRKRAEGPNLLELPVQPRRRGLPAWVAVIGVLLAGNGALLGWLLLRHKEPVATEVAPRPTAPTSLGASAPLAASPGAAAAPLPGTAPAGGAGSAPAATQAIGSAQAPGNAPALPQAPSGRGYAAQPSPAPALAANDGDNPADDAPAVEPPTPRRSAVRSGASLPSYGSLGGALPPLHMDLHFWSEVPAERYALINLHRVGEGDLLPEGPRVLEITRDGVVMEYQGREFMLGRD